MNQETVAQKAKRLLQPIPEDQWKIGSGVDVEYKWFGLKRKYKACALTHYASKELNINIKKVGLDIYSSELNVHSKNFMQKVKNDYSNWIYHINDTSERYHPYRANTPKKRVMLLLDDMIKHGY